MEENLTSIPWGTDRHHTDAFFTRLYNESCNVLYVSVTAKQINRHQHQPLTKGSVWSLLFFTFAEAKEMRIGVQKTAERKALCMATTRAGFVIGIVIHLASLCGEVEHSTQYA